MTKTPSTVMKKLVFGLLMATGFSAWAADNGITDSDIRIGQFAAQTGPAGELGKRRQLGTSPARR